MSRLAISMLLLVLGIQRIVAREYVSSDFDPSVTGTATGYFHVERLDGRWWMVDPLGRGTFLRGVDHVRRDGVNAGYRDWIDAHFSAVSDWEAEAVSRLKAWGFNCIGPGASATTYARGLPYADCLSIGLLAARRTGADFPDVESPDFPRLCEEIVKGLVAQRRVRPEDPYLVGYFLDNELPWWTFKDETPERRRALARHYFEGATAALRKYDPNHMILGVRFAGFLIGGERLVWEECAKCCEVVSVNCYPWADLDRNAVFEDRGRGARRIDAVFAERSAWVDKPLMVTEWSFPSLDSGLPCTSGAGQRFRTQAERARAAILFARTMLASPSVVGYGYFMWCDENAQGNAHSSENTNYGLVTERNQPYECLTEAFARLHRETYRWRHAAPPAENAVDPVHAGLSAEAYLASRRVSARAVCAVSSNGWRYENREGLAVRGARNGTGPIAEVSLKGKALGHVLVTVCFSDKGVLSWIPASAVVNWTEEKDDLIVETEGVAFGAPFRMKTRLVVPQTGRGFLAEIVSVENLSSNTALVVKNLLIQPFAPFAADDAQRQDLIPELWKAPRHASWVAADGRWFGSITASPACELFRYWLDPSKNPHPDVFFSMPSSEYTLNPGQEYRPGGTAYLWCQGGLDGLPDQWK